MYYVKLKFNRRISMYSSFDPNNNEFVNKLDEKERKREREDQFD